VPAEDRPESRRPRRWLPGRLRVPVQPLFLLVAHHLNYPDGVNLMWNTSLVLPGLVLAPLTTRFGPVLSFNVLLVLAYGLSAWCAYLAIVRWRVGSVVVGPMPNRAVMVEFLTDLLGARPERVGGVYLWRDPKVVTTPPAGEKPL
jgi:hypothetical protein